MPGTDAEPSAAAAPSEGSEPAAPDPTRDVRSDDDRDVGWGDDREPVSEGDRDTRWYEEQRPPHWE